MTTRFFSLLTQFFQCSLGELLSLGPYHSYLLACLKAKLCEGLHRFESILDHQRARWGGSIGLCADFCKRSESSAVGIQDAVKHGGECRRTFVSVFASAVLGV